MFFYLTGYAMTLIQSAVKLRDAYHHYQWLQNTLDQTLYHMKSQALTDFGPSQSHYLKYPQSISRPF